MDTHTMDDMNQTPSLATFRKLINVCSMENNLDHAYKAWTDMLDHSISPSADIVSAVLRMCSDAADELQCKENSVEFASPPASAVAGHRERPNVTWGGTFEQLDTLVVGLAQVVQDLSVSQPNHATKRNASQLESAWSMLFRSLCFMNKHKDAMSYFIDMRHRKIVPRLRTYAPLIAAFGTNGNALEADMLLCDLRQHEDITPTEAEYGFVLYAYGKFVQMNPPDSTNESIRQLSDLCTSNAPLVWPNTSDVHSKHIVQRRIHTILHDATEYIYKSSSAFHDVVAAAFKSCNTNADVWHSQTFEVDENGYCEHTNEHLRSIDLDANELNVLRLQTEKLAARSSKCKLQLEAFDKWLDTHNREFDVIIDGANVGFYNQNFAGGGFSYLQVDYAVNYFQKHGHKVLLILHSSWLKEGKSFVARGKRKRSAMIRESGEEGNDVSEEDKADNIRAQHRKEFGQSWKNQGLLYEVQPGNNDDWYWLFAAVTSPHPCFVVSNDQMRDHHFSMLSPKHFLKWRERRQCKFRFQTLGNKVDSDRILHVNFPSKFSHRMQSNTACTAWYLARNDNDSLWTCIWMDSKQSDDEPQQEEQKQQKQQPQQPQPQPQQQDI